MTEKTIDGITFRLSRDWDTSALEKELQRYGRVTKVWDDQDSGNLCFGLLGDGGRKFVKFAGAPTARCTGDPADAVLRLREIVPTYRELAHPALIKLIGTFDTDGGMGAVFEWANGICMGRQYPEDHAQFMRLSQDHKHRVYRDILTFFRHVITCGWYPVDFYDGSVLYDPSSGKTTVCDIDFYRKGTFVNEMGRMWGSSRFMSPEEKTLGDVIDERTVVYLMGATAFALFTDSDRSEDAWCLTYEAYSTVTKAVSEDKNDRYQTIDKYIHAWETSL